MFNMTRIMKVKALFGLPVLMLMSGNLQAEVSGLFTYQVVNGGVHITDYPDNVTGHVEIPAEIDGKPVTAITGVGQTGAFFGSKLASVTIPPTVTLIGDAAFAICLNLESVVIPDSVTTIGDSAFYQSFNMKSVSFGSHVTSIGHLSFFACRALTSLVLPPSITSIRPRAFESCTELRSVVFSEGLTTIGASAFLNCFRLKSVTLPASVTFLGNNCFVDCPLSSAVFLGNAPIVSGNLFRKTDPEFNVFFISGKTGFTAPVWTPKWTGFPAQVIGAAPSPAQKWLLEHDLPMQTPLEQEPDGTGVSLLTAYALGLDPFKKSASGLHAVSLLPNRMAMTFFAGRPDITYTAQISTNLQDWSTEGVTISPLDASGHRTASAATDTRQKFMRLLIEK